MGATCTNCTTCVPSDQQTVITVKRQEEDPGLSAERKQSMEDKLALIVKMQAWARGAAVRRKLPDLTAATPIM